MAVIALGISAVFGWFYLQKRGEFQLPLVNPVQTPRYLFSIYGNDQKPLKAPMSVFVDRRGNIYAASTNGHEIQVFQPQGKYRFSFGHPGPKPGELAYPYGIAENQAGNLLIAETGNGRVQEFTPAGKFVRVVTARGGVAGIEKPGPLLFKDGRLYVADLLKQTVFVLDGNGKMIQKLGPVNFPHGLATDRNGRMYVSDSGGYRIAIFNAKGQNVQNITKFQGENTFSLLRGVAVDKLGRIFAVDSLACTVRVFAPDGQYLFSFGSQGFDKGQFLYPTGIFIDNKLNRIFIADWANNRIEVWGY